MLNKNRLNKGFTLVELMISLVIGLLISAAGLTMFVNTADTDFDQIKMTRLNQELRAVMSLMTRDIRRTGYYGIATTSPTTISSGLPTIIGTATWNPFIKTGGNFLFSLQDIYNGDSDASTYDCILFAYDEDRDGVDDGNNERFGYRLAPSSNPNYSGRNTLKVRQSGADCTGNNWEALTDDSIIEVTEFTLTPRREIIGDDGTLVVCNIDITLSARFANVAGYDTNIVRSINETVKIRNDIYHPATTTYLCQ